MLGNLWFDLKYAWRLTLKARWYSLLCVVVVALSVGLALWAYVLVYTLAIKQLPYAGSDRWLSVQVAPNATSTSTPALDAYTYQEILKRSRTANHIGAYATRNAVLSTDEASASLRVAKISPSLMSALHPAPLSGRVFEASDAQQGATPVAILSYDAWQTWFAGDRTIVGKQARIDGNPVQIIAVMPRDFYAFDDFDVLAPLQLPPLAKPADSAIMLSAFVALKDGQTSEQLMSEMAPALEQVRKEYPRLFNAGRHLELVPAHLMTTHGFIPIAAMISFIAIAVLLLGAVNISLVFFARLLERSRELGLRTALGSTRSRLLRQCLLESVFIMLLGLGLGVILTALGVRWTRGISELMTQFLANGRDMNPLMLRAPDLIVGIVLAAALWLLSTLLPAWRVAKQDPAAALSGTGKGVAATGNSKAAGVLVGLQVVVSCIVLVICVNLLSAVREETSKPRGVDSSHLIVSTYPTVFGTRYPDQNARERYLEALSTTIRSRIADSQVAYSTAVPTRPDWVAIAVEQEERATDQPNLHLPLMAVSGNYFELLGIAVRSGRAFDATDKAGTLDVAIVDEATVKHFWPGENPLGKRVRLNPASGGPWLTIVGVVAQVGHQPYSPASGLIYRPLAQANPDSFFLTARLPNITPDARVQLRSAAFSVDRELPLHNLQTLDDYLRALDISVTALVPAFGVIAAITVILAATGLFGLISRSVARRTQEIGIRRALGGTPGRIVRIFLRQGALYLGVGLLGGCAGVMITALLTQAVPNALSHAASVTASVFLLIVLVVFLASWLPARRALALEPGDALRYD